MLHGGAMANRFKVLVITGMTGTQKTKLAISAAKRLNGELICGDLTQMYRGLPILTNKQRGIDPDPIHGDAKAGKADSGASPNFLNRDGIEKHMYQRYELGKEPSTQEYTLDARKAVLDVLARGKVPILEGGSIYFFKNVFKGNSLEESPEHVAAMQTARLKARDMVADLQAFGDGSRVVNADVDGLADSVTELVKKVGMPDFYD